MRKKGFEYLIDALGRLPLSYTDTQGEPPLRERVADQERVEEDRAPVRAAADRTSRARPGAGTALRSSTRPSVLRRLDAQRRVRGYRAGYLPLHRREIEAGIHVSGLEHFNVALDGGNYADGAFVARLRALDAAEAA